MVDTQLHASWRGSERTGHLDSAQTDEYLITQVRSGSLPHFGILYRRHKPSADRLARLLSETGEADDLVAEAFSQTLTQLLANKGPEVSFRAYLLTTVRNTHFRSFKGQQKLFPTDDEEKLDRPAQDEDMVLRSHDDDSVRRAFESLPEKWQLVLWHLEVERERPAQVADRLAMSANGVSALALRAREGLRQAYLRQHAEEASSPACRQTLDLLPGYVRAKRKRRKHADAEQHLTNCASCHAAYLELSEMNGRLGVVLAPALLGVVGWQYLSSAPGTGLSFLAHPWEWFQHHVVGNASHSAPLAAKIGISAVVAVTVVTVVTISQALEDPDGGTQASVTDTLILDPQATTSTAPDRPAATSPPTSVAPGVEATDVRQDESASSAAAPVELLPPTSATPMTTASPRPAPAQPRLSETSVPIPAPVPSQPAETAPAPEVETAGPTSPSAAPTEPVPSAEPSPTSLPPATESPSAAPTEQPEPEPEPTPPQTTESPPTPLTTALAVGPVAVERRDVGTWRVTFTPHAEASIESGFIDLTTVIHLESAAVLTAAGGGWSCAAPSSWGVVLPGQAVTCTLAWDVSAPLSPASITVASVNSPSGRIALSSNDLSSETRVFGG